MPEEKKFTARFDVRVTPAMKAELEEFARTHEVSGGVAESIRRFIRLGLDMDRVRRGLPPKGSEAEV